MVGCYLALRNYREESVENIFIDRCFVCWRCPAIPIHIVKETSYHLFVFFDRFGCDENSYFLTVP